MPGIHVPGIKYHFAPPAPARTRKPTPRIYMLHSTPELVVTAMIQGGDQSLVLLILSILQVIGYGAVPEA